MLYKHFKNYIPELLPLNKLFAIAPQGTTVCLVSGSERKGSHSVDWLSKEPKSWWSSRDLTYRR